MTITKKVLADEVCKVVEGIDPEVSAKIIDAIFDKIKSGLANGDRLEVRGFGSINLFHSNRTKVRNMSKGEPMLIAPHKRPKLRPCPSFVELCNKK